MPFIINCKKYFGILSEFMTAQTAAHVWAEIPGQRSALYSLKSDRSDSFFRFGSHVSRYLHPEHSLQDDSARSDHLVRLSEHPGRT